MNIVESLQSPALLGGLPDFRDLTSWSRWLIFLKATYGLPLDPAELPIFQHHTGLSGYDPPPGGWPEIALVCGRQSGKSEIAALIATHEAVGATPPADGTQRYALLVAQDHRSSIRALLGYCRAPFLTVPAFTATLRSQTDETLTLTSGTTVAAYPCRPPAVRGLRAVVAIADELAHFRNAEGNPLDRAMLRALRPTTSMTHGKTIILSSPVADRGALYELHERYWGKPGSPTLVWTATAPEMNPLLPADYLERMKQDDPEAYRSEVLGEFRAGVASYLPARWVDAVVVAGRTQLEPRRGVRYLCGVDTSSLVNDEFVATVCHVDSTSGKIVQDALWAWGPHEDGSQPNLAAVIAEIAEHLARYGLRKVHGDRYAAGPMIQLFSDAGLVYAMPETRPLQRGPKRFDLTEGVEYLTKSRAYLTCLPVFTSQGVELLDDGIQSQQWKGLQRTAKAGGDDTVTHRGGGHDDRSNAAALAIALLAPHASFKPVAVPILPSGVELLGYPRPAGFGQPRPVAGRAGAVAGGAAGGLARFARGRR